MRALYWLLLFCMRSQCLASHVTVDQRDDVKENATVDDYDFDPLNATVAESFLENKLPNLPRGGYFDVFPPDLPPFPPKMPTQYFSWVVLRHVTKPRIVLENFFDKKGKKVPVVDVNAPGYDFDYWVEELLEHTRIENDHYHLSRTNGLSTTFGDDSVSPVVLDSGRLRGGGLISSLRAVISSLSSDAEITHTAYPAEEGGNNNEASGSGTLESEVVQVDVSLEGVNVVLSNQDVQNAEIPGGLETDVGSHQVDDKVDDSSAGCSFDFHQPLETVDTVHVHDCGQDDVSPGVCIIGTLGPQNQQTASPVEDSGNQNVQQPHDENLDETIRIHNCDRDSQVTFKCYNVIVQGHSSHYK
ncbi:hypothetical protein CYMTET_13606 [Cymbomonas tetramitiformis]|uniref:Uncharacterized protein n=1 Tax=Cymbomonas tetramitiformis TaxID=36881 RepID=A0AAE0GI20_9CHLO|nr:hypothetical protein CYMTET_13606 [Cymbomonas tetramitiformis]